MNKITRSWDGELGFATAALQEPDAMMRQS